MWWITARLCEMKRYVRPSRCCNSRIRFKTCACTETSSADVGSSQTRNRGDVDSARAIEIRCRWPPENWCGYLDPSARARPTCARSAAARELSSRFDVSGACAAIGSAITLATLQRGLRLAYGSWKIICMPRRAARCCALSTAWSPARMAPSNSIVPRVGA
jgi:hypothetical protein